MPRPKNDAKCASPMCDRKQRSLGYCSTHYRRFKLYGDPNKLMRAETNAGKVCAHCDGPVSSRGMCDRHYQMWKLHGDPLHSDKRDRPYGKLVSDVGRLHDAHPGWPAVEIAKAIGCDTASVYAAARRRDIQLPSGHAVKSSDLQRPIMANKIRKFLAEHPNANARDIGMHIGKTASDVSSIARNSGIQLRKLTKDERAVACRIGWGIDVTRSVREDRNIKAYERRKANPEKYKVYGENYRALKAGAEGRYSEDDVLALLKRQKNRCAHPWCRKILRNGKHLDHIQPLSKGGTNWPSNLQYLCQKCNLQKGAKDPIKFAQLNGMLL